MALELDEKSNTYLHNELQIGQLRANTFPVEIQSPHRAVPDLFPLARTTGNGIIYWDGGIILESNISPNDQIGSFSIVIAPKQIRYVSGLVYDGATWFPLGISFTDDGTIRSLSDLISGNVIYFMSINYFRG